MWIGLKVKICSVQSVPNFNFKVPWNSGPKVLPQINKLKFNSDMQAQKKVLFFKMHQHDV